MGLPCTEILHTCICNLCNCSYGIGLLYTHPIDRSSTIVEKRVNTESSVRQLLNRSELVPTSRTNDKQVDKSTSLASYFCIKCGCKFKSSQEVKYHMKEVHPGLNLVLVKSKNGRLVGKERYSYDSLSLYGTPHGDQPQLLNQSRENSVCIDEATADEHEYELEEPHVLNGRNRKRECISIT